MSTYKSWLEKTKKQINKTYDTQKEQTESIYNRAINQASSEYESSYRQNEVDRIFNEKKIAEINANLGLTKSGLNRTQQTAVQLSHANRDYEISKERQNAIDDIALEKAGKVAEIENSRQTALNTAQSEYETMKTSAQAKTVEATPEYEYWAYEKEDDENENKVIFSDGKGNTKSIVKGINPYTGLPVANPGGFDVWNGYQPKGVYYKGINVGEMTNQGMGEIEYQGHSKKVWRTYNSVRIDGMRVNFWVWDDYKGSYVPVIKDGDGEYCIYQE